MEKETHPLPSPAEEAQLVARLVEGDEQAFCLLYAYYKKRLCYFALQFLKSDERVEDVFQDVFTQIWQGRQFINPSIPFSAYLYTLIRNRVFNELRSMEKEHTLREHLVQHALDYSHTPQDEIREHELQAILQKAFEHLTTRQREVFRLSREGQLSYKEIAEQLGLSVHTVHEHITDSLRILRRYLAKYGETPADLLLLLWWIKS